MRNKIIIAKTLYLIGGVILTLGVGGNLLISADSTVIDPSGNLLSILLGLGGGMIGVGLLLLALSGRSNRR